MPRHRRIGAYRDPAKVGHVGIAGKGFLPGDDEVAGLRVFHRQRLQAGQIGAGFGFAVADKPGQLAAHHLRQQQLLLIVAAEGEQGIRHIGDRTIETGRAEVFHLVPENRLIDAAAAAAAVLLRPAHADVAGGAKLAAECLGEGFGPHALLGLVAVRSPHLRREFAGQEGTHRGAKFKLFRCQVEIHHHSFAAIGGQAFR